MALNTLVELKESAYELWVKIHRDQDQIYPAATPATDAYFKAKVRDLVPDGVSRDLRKKSTWEYIYSGVKAMRIWQASADNYCMVKTALIERPIAEGWEHLIPKIVQFLCIKPDTFRAMGQGIAANILYGGASFDALMSLLQLITAMAPADYLPALVEVLEQELEDSTELPIMLEVLSDRRRRATESVPRPVIAA